MNYVDRNKLHTLYVNYYNECVRADADNTARPAVPEYICTSILKIANKTIWKERWMRMPDRDNMIGNGIYEMTKAVMKLKYDPQHESGNLFGYLVKSCENAFLDIQRDETRATTIIHAYAQRYLVTLPDNRTEERKNVQEFINERQDYADFHKNYLEKKREKQRRKSD